MGGTVISGVLPVTDSKLENRVLFVRHWAIGDVLLTTPFFHQLQKDFSGVSIDFLSLHGGVVEGTPGFGRWLSIKEVTLDRKLLGSYAQTYWFSYEHDPTLHILDGYEISTGIQLQDKTIRWTMLPGHQAAARARLAGHPRPWIGLSLTSPSPLRTIPAAKIQEIIDGAVSRVGGTVVVASDQRLDLSSCINLTGQLACLQDLGALIKECDAWVTVDSAPLHIAQALGVRTVGIFGCTLPELRVTRPSCLSLVRNESLDCLGCYHRLPPLAEALPSCARGDLACMNGLDVETVIKALESSLEERPDEVMLSRFDEYERYRSRRIENLPKGYAESVVESYRARVCELNARPGFFRRFERQLRHHRKTLNAWWRESE